MKKFIAPPPEATVKLAKRFFKHQKTQLYGFTLAEVLITLGIIGIISALTIPVLISNHKKKVIATQLKQSYSIIYNAIELSVAENETYENWNRPYNQPNSTKKFAEQYILPYIKYAQTGQDKHFYANEDLFYIKLVNGTIVALHVGSCVDFLVDINGDKQPNKGGVDQFTFYLNMFQNSAFPTGFSSGNKSRTKTQLILECKNSPNNCAKLIEYENWKITKDYPQKI